MAVVDLCRFNPTLGGTTSWVYSTAVAGCQSPALSNVQNALPYKVYAVSADLSQWEISQGVYNSSTGTFPRTTVLYNSLGTGTAAGQSGAGTLINFSTVPQVAVVGLAEDLLAFDTANNFTTGQQAQARTNLGTMGVVYRQIFSASGTYTPNANMIYCIIEVVGGGGGGGGIPASSSGTITTAGGGGSGAFGMLYATAATIGASKAVTVGAGGAGGAAGPNGGNSGGATSVGTICTAGGGIGGGTMGGAAGGYIISGGGGGGAGVGDVTTPGSPGCAGIGLSDIACGGNGGPSVFGGAGAGGQPSGGVGYFGSGGGGASSSNGAAAASGGAGGAGYVIITEFRSQ